MDKTGELLVNLSIYMPIHPFLVFLFVFRRLLIPFHQVRTLKDAHCT